jgi:hypothetical protein
MLAFPVFLRLNLLLTLPFFGDLGGKFSKQRLQPGFQPE